jgi:aspartate/methionine/tyrosine aminotransferase
LERQYPLYPLEMDQLFPLVEKRQKEGREVFDLCLGVSSFDVSKYATLDLHGASVATNIASYGAFVGHRSLRESVAAFYSKLAGRDINPERVVITNGGSGALLIASMLLLDARDELLLPEVFYCSYPILGHLLGARSRTVPLLETYETDPRAYRAAVGPSTRALILNSPSNPMGTVTTRAVMEELVDVGLPIISDEVYLPLALNECTSMLSITDNAYVVGSFSKAFAAPGLRVGFLIVPELAIRQAEQVQASVTISTSAVAQLVAEQLISNSDAILVAHREHLRQRLVGFLKACDELELPLFARPQTGFFGLVDISKTKKSSVEVARELVQEHGVLVAPGCDFAAGDPGFVRVNFACATATLAEAVLRIKRYLSSHSAA